MNSFAFGKHSRKFPNCLSPLHVWKVSFKSTWTLVAYFQMVATVHPCHTLRDRSMGTFHGENWPKALSEHGRGGISVILTPNQRFWVFFDHEFFPAELAEGRFQTWIRLVWVVLICGKISDWCWSCSIHARKIGADPWNISQKSKEAVGLGLPQVLFWVLKKVLKKVFSPESHDKSTKKSTQKVLK